MNDIDYFSMIGKDTNGFYDNGWADGYADLPSEHNIILDELSERVSDTILIHCLDMYLQGYELGSFMSSNSSEIYDEDGNLNDDEYDLFPLSHYDEAERLVFCKKK